MKSFFFYVRFKVKSDNYLRNLHEFWQACKALGLKPARMATAWRKHTKITTITIEDTRIFPWLYGKVQVGDIIKIEIHEQGDEVKL